MQPVGLHFRTSPLQNRYVGRIRRTYYLPEEKIPTDLIEAVQKEKGWNPEIARSP